jgi:hypothetical protein
MLEESIPLIKPRVPITADTIGTMLLKSSKLGIQQTAPPTGATEAIMKTVLDKLKKVRAMPQYVVSVMDASLVMDANGELIQGSGLQKVLYSKLPEQIETVVLVHDEKQRGKLIEMLGDRQARVKIVNIEGRTSITRAIIDEYNSRDIEITPRSISIALPEDKAISAIRGDRDADIEDNRYVANYVVLSDEAIAEISDPSSNDINVFNILMGLASKSNTFLGIGISEPTETRLRDLLQGIMATIRIIRINIAKGIREFVHSVRQTSISL